MGVKFKRTSLLKDFPAKLKTELAKELGIIATNAIEDIQNRTANQGVDANGSQFKPYSKSYQSQKSRKTKVSVSKPNLTVSGHMLQSLISEVVQKGAAVVARIFSSSNDGNERIQWNMKTRKFFLVSESQKKDFQRRLGEIIRGIK